MGPVDTFNGLASVPRSFSSIKRLMFPERRPEDDRLVLIRGDGFLHQHTEVQSCGQAGPSEAVFWRIGTTDQESDFIDSKR